MLARFGRFVRAGCSPNLTRLLCGSFDLERFYLFVGPFIATFARWLTQAGRLVWRCDLRLFVLASPVIGRVFDRPGPRGLRRACPPQSPAVSRSGQPRRAMLTLALILIVQGHHVLPRIGTWIAIHFPYARAGYRLIESRGRSACSSSPHHGAVTASRIGGWLSHWRGPQCSYEHRRDRSHRFADDDIASLLARAGTGQARVTWLLVLLSDFRSLRPTTH